MSKHINLVINDTLYSSIVLYMKANHIKNFSFAVRILLTKQLDSLSICDKTESEEITDELAKQVANVFSEYFSTELSEGELNVEEQYYDYM